MLPAHALIPTGIACLALGAQTPWTTILPKAFPRARPDEVVLLVRPEDLAMARAHVDELLFRLRAEGQFVFVPTAMPRDLPDTVRWVLVNAQGEVGSRGPGGGP